MPTNLEPSSAFLKLFVLGAPETDNWSQLGEANSAFNIQSRNPPLKRHSQWPFFHWAELELPELEFKDTCTVWVL